MQFRNIALALGVAALAVPAFAQESKPIGLSVKAGLMQPSHRAARDEGKQWFIGGIEYRIQDIRVSATNPSYTAHLSATADFFQKGDMGATPVLINYVGRTNEWYYMAGVGVSFNRDYSIRADERETRNTSRFAYALRLGYDFQHRRTPLFVEGTYFGNNNDRLNGFAVMVGIRL